MTETEAVSITSVMTPSTPQYQTLKAVYDRWIAAKDVAEKAAADVEALNAELVTIAQSIKEQGIVDDNWELAPTFESKSMEKVDSARMKELHPEIYEKCDPHVDNHGGMAILKKVHGEAQLQQMLHDIDPAMYREKSNVTKAAVTKNCTKSEIQALREDGCLFINTTYGGEIKLIPKAIQAERARLHAPKRDDDDDWDAEDDA